MQLRTCTRPLAYAIAAAAFLASAPVNAEPGDVYWELIRPTNTGIAGDFVQSIFIDDDDSPWISAYTPFWEEGGLSHPEGDYWRVLSNVDCPQIGNEIGSPRFNDIVKTDDGVMWIGTGRGLLRFDPSVQPWCVTKFTPANSGIAGADVSNIDIAPDGTLWLACSTWGGSTQGGLSQYDPATDTWQSWDTSNGLPWWAGWDWVTYVAVQPDAGGGYTVWFGSSEMGLTTYKDGLFIWYGSPTPPDESPLPTGVGGHDPVDDNGNLLLMTDQGIAFRSPSGEYTVVGGYPFGLSSEVAIFEPISGGRVLLGTYYADVFLWDNNGWTWLGDWGSGNHTYALVEDSTGAFWAGGIGGSSKYEDGFWQRYRLTNTGMLSFFLNTIAFDDLGNVYMDANAGPGVGGFDVLHPDRTWTNANDATYGIGWPWGLPTDSTSDIAVRDNGNIVLALGGIQGIVEFDPEALQYIYLTPQGYDFETVAIDGLGRVWGGRYGSGAFLITAPMQYQIFSSGNSPLPVAEVVDIIPDPNQPGYIYIGAPFGIAHTDGVNWTVWPREEFDLYQDTIGHHIIDFDVAADGTFWVASGLGLNHYDPATGINARHDLTNAPLPSDDVDNVEVAPDGSVWITMFDQVAPYPGGLAQLKNEQWRVWRQGTSPLPHNQIWDLASRPTDTGYEVWVATASEAMAVVSVEGEPACVADFNNDGLLDFFDVADFLDAFSATDITADLATDGLFNFFDVQEFLARFADGC